MNLKQYFEATRGAQARLAEATVIPASLLCMWARGSRDIPAERCIEIETATNGDVRCEEMRPDINWSVLRKPPELSQAEQGA